MKNIKVQQGQTKNSFFFYLRLLDAGKDMMCIKEKHSSGVMWAYNM